MIDKMHYVEDQYNDRDIHFNIAYERYFIINSIDGKNKVNERIDALRRRLRHTSLTDHPKFIGEFPDKKRS